MSKAMLGIALIALNRGANAEIAHDEVAGFLQLLLTPAAVGDKRAPAEADASRLTSIFRTLRNER